MLRQGLGKKILRDVEINFFLISILSLIQLYYFYK